MTPAEQSPHAGYFVHETSCIDESVAIGAGTKIWHFCHVMSGAVIGERCVLGQNVFVGGRVRIGNNVHIQNNVSVYDGVTLEDDVFCGPSMVFTNVANPRSHFPRKNEFRDTLVRRGASLGANATVLCGVTIGRYAFVGAGAVVLGSVPDYALVYGVPASVRGWMCTCGVRLPLGVNEGEEAGRCAHCGRAYRRLKDYVTEIASNEAGPS